MPVSILRGQIRVCAAAIVIAFSTAQAQTTEPAPPKQTVTIVPEAADARIAQRLERILKATEWFSGVRVTVQDGVAFLDGTTSTAERQRWAGNLAENTQGAVAVVNRIAIQADAQSVFSRAASDFSALYHQAVKAWPLVALAILVILITWLVAKLVAMAVRRAFAARIPSPLLLSVVSKAFAIPFFLLGVYFILEFFGLTQLALTVLGGTGLIGIIIGLSFREIAENFLASILLSVRNPFHKGDLIEVAGHTGVIENLNARSTILLTFDGNHVQIPNALVYKSIIKNFSSIPSRRADFAVGIGYDSQTTVAQSLILNVLRKHPAVLDAPEPLVLVEELGSASLHLRAYYWFDSTVHSPIKINSALLRLTKEALLDGGIEMPDPAREVIFPKGVPIVRLSKDQETEERNERDVERLHPEEPKSVTPAEGDLANETAEMARQQPGDEIPEAADNLLKS